MSRIRRSARVPYDGRQMLALVNDIESYPSFLHWCRRARIERESGETVEAALDVGISGIHRTLRTRNSTQQTEDDVATIRIDMIDGPLKRLCGSWTFRDLPQGGSDIELALEYDVHRTPFGMLLKSLFDEIANSQLNAFIRRADAVYGADRHA